MKIEFDEDGSFLEFLSSGKDLTLVMCGIKSYRQVTMSSANLSEEQVSEIIEFLVDWREQNK